MKTSLSYPLIVLVIIFASPLLAAAADFDLKISEIMYDPAGKETWQETSYSREWIEIANVGDESIIIGPNWRICDQNDCETGYHIVDKKAVGGDFIVSPQESVILADSVEAFKEDYPDFSGTVIDTVLKLKNGALAGFPADFVGIYKKNSDQWLEIDSVAYYNSWGASDNGFSLEKINLAGPNDSSNWRQSAVSGGTPGKPNSQSQVFNFQVQNEEKTSGEANALEMTASSTPASGASPEYSKDVIINEFLPDPIDSDLEGEWIEIYNSGENQTDLAGWQLDDEEGGGNSNPYVVPPGVFISPKSYLVFSRPTTGIAINNDKDSARLLWPNGGIADAASFSEKAPEGKSLNRLEKLVNGEKTIKWRWSKVLTPGSANIIEGPDPELDANQQTNTNAASAPNNIINDSSPQSRGEITNAENAKAESPKEESGQNQMAAVSKNISSFSLLTRYFLPILIAFGAGFLVLFLQKKVF